MTPMKIRKIVSLACVIAIVSVMLTGCKALDKERNNQAYFKDDRTEILYHGKTYKMLPECEELEPLSTPDDYRTVSKQDVPILISLMRMNEGIIVTQNEELITGEYNEMAYARSDVYDKYVELIKNYKLDRYVYWYSYYDKKAGYYTQALKDFEAADLETIRAAEDGAEVIEQPEDGLYGEELSLMITDETNLFRRESMLLIYSDGDSYIVDRGVTYKVANEYVSKIREIITKCNEYEYEFEQEIQ